MFDRVLPYKDGFSKVLDGEEEFFLDKTGNPVPIRAKVYGGSKFFGAIWLSAD